MATTNYDTEKLNLALSNLARLREKVTSLLEDCNSLDKIDNRITKYYNDKNGYFSELDKSRTSLGTDEEKVGEVSSWLDASIVSLGLTITTVNEISSEVDEYEGNTGVEQTTEYPIGIETRTESEITTEHQTNTNVPNGVDETETEEINTETKTTDEEPQDVTPVVPTTPNDDFNSLTPEEQAAIIALLKKAGYSDDEISKILAGLIGIPLNSLSKIKELLEKLYGENQSIRDYFIKNFNIDIFNEDGTIDLYKLYMIILADLKDDSFDLFADLREKYGIEVPMLENLDALIKALEHALQENPKLRQEIINKYGFDIFNEDGTINLAMLKLLLLIDALSDNPQGILDLLLANLDSNPFITNNLDAFSILLVGLLKLYPDLADYIIEKYGFDIFNEDGTVNLENLKLALILDAQNGDTDLLQLLSDKYGIEVPSKQDVDALSILLIKLLEDDPDLRQYLIDKYGFDIFNEDGTINIDKLRIAVTLDNLSDTDAYDMIKTIADRYGLDIPPMDKLNEFAKLLLELYAKDPSIREYLLKKYGFDIFNEDGTINFKKLLIALLMDQIDKDDFDLIKYLTELNPPTDITVPIEDPNIQDVDDKPPHQPISPHKPDIPHPNTPIDTTDIDNIDGPDKIDETIISTIDEPIIEEPIIEDNFMIDEPIIEDNYNEEILIEATEQKTTIEDKKTNNWGALAIAGVALGAVSLGAYKIIKGKDEDDDDYKEDEN